MEWSNTKIFLKSRVLQQRDHSALVHKNKVKIYEICCIIKLKFIIDRMKWH